MARRARQRKEMKMMSAKKMSVRLPQAVKLKAGNSNFLSVLIQFVHSLRLTLAMLLTDISNSSIGWRIRCFFFVFFIKLNETTKECWKRSFKRNDNQKEKQKSEVQCCAVQSLTIFLIAALEWLAAVEISSSASVTSIHIYNCKHVSRKSEIRINGYQKSKARESICPSFSNTRTHTNK